MTETAAAATAALLLLSLTSHILTGRIRYVKQLKQKQVTKAQKAWANGERQSAQSMYDSLTQDIEDYNQLEWYMVRVRAALFIISACSAVLTLALYIR